MKIICESDVVCYKIYNCNQFQTKIHLRIKSIAPFRAKQTLLNA
jgi:hypothetical protein